MKGFVITFKNSLFASSLGLTPSTIFLVIWHKTPHSSSQNSPTYNKNDVCENLVQQLLNEQHHLYLNWCGEDRPNCGPNSRRSYDTSINSLRIGRDGHIDLRYNHNLYENTRRWAFIYTFHHGWKLLSNVLFSPEIHSIGRRMITDSQLNMSCTVAPAKALLNSFLSITWVNATSVFVTEVPMLAPITMNMAGLMSMTTNRNNTDIFNNGYVKINRS